MKYLMVPGKKIFHLAIEGKTLCQLENNKTRGLGDPNGKPLDLVEIDPTKTPRVRVCLNCDRIYIRDTSHGPA